MYIFGYKKMYVIKFKSKLINIILYPKYVVLYIFVPRHTPVGTY